MNLVKQVIEIEQQILFVCVCMEFETWKKKKKKGDSSPVDVFQPYHQQTSTMLKHSAHYGMPTEPKTSSTGLQSMR